MNIIYLRVSKEDESKQNPDQQLKEIIKKFELKDYTIYSERGSAYDLSKIKKRQKFIEILRLCFDSNTTTIEDVYLHNLPKKQVTLYVWDYSRIIRNIELNLFFSLLSYWCEVKIVSYKDKAILKESDNETPTLRLTRIMMNTISAFSSEEYSHTISTNTKKAYKSGFSIGKNGEKGNKWGRLFKGTSDNPENNENGNVSLPLEGISSLNRRILFLITQYSQNKTKCYYDLIVEDVRKKFKLDISKSYISKLKNGKTR